jgi:hypothetical protein
MTTDAYTAGRYIEALRRQAYAETDPARAGALLDELIAAEGALEKSGDGAAETEAETDERGVVGAERLRIRRGIEAIVMPGLDDPSLPTGGVVVDRAKSNGLLGADTTGLLATVTLRMAQVPTAIAHLLDPTSSPLVTCTVDNQGTKPRRVRVSSFVDGYSAPAVTTVELKKKTEHSFDQFPTFFPERVRQIDEITRATLNVLVDDLDTHMIELHVTQPIWLLPRTCAPLAIMDPMTRKSTDTTKYFVAYVTPNAPAIQGFLQHAYDKHPEHKLVGFQGERDGVEPQVRAIFDALKADAGIHYVNSVLSNTLADGLSSQRVRLPRESLENKEANCIDGTVLFASLLEAISLSPAIVLVPGHAFLAWETWTNSNEWRYLEATMIGDNDFDTAVISATTAATRYSEAAKSSGRATLFRLLPVREARSIQGVFPME